ncbi:MAG: AmmeMemoRadiSam system protein A [Clostridia bacterium]|nr:AmmeMemoRadiSam system protein A [Clostridia bacterium]
MGELVLAALSPHPPIIIPEVGGSETPKASRTVQGMKALATAVADAAPDTVVVISPHGPVFADAIAITGLPRISGDFSQFGADVSLSFECDLDLARSVVHHAEAAEVSCVLLDERAMIRMRIPRKLDHGTLVPLSYIWEHCREFRLIPVAMGVGAPNELYSFGIALREAIEAGSGRVAVIASGDLSHALAPGAPAGYSPRGAQFDSLVVEALSSRDAAALAGLDDKLVASAGECGLRAIFMMLGAIDGLDVISEVHSYEGPFGVGYAVATFRPSGQSEASRAGELNNALHLRADARRRSESAHAALARNAAEAYVVRRQVIDAPDPLPANMRGRAGVFCSIHKGRELRGCIGTTEPMQACIAEEIISNAISAAVRDPRFEPVAQRELADLAYSVDVLSEPEDIDGPEELDPAKYGVIVRRGDRVGLLLPDLDGVDSVEQQVSIARRKAGIGPGEPLQYARFEVKRYE